jgi:hypothetical protein
MINKPNHICFRECPACAFELGQQLARKKPNEHAKYVWMIVGSDNPCDIRRYAFSHEEGMEQLSHTKNFKDFVTGGTWTLFKLIKVKRQKQPPKGQR